MQIVEKPGSVWQGQVKDREENDGILDQPCAKGVVYQSLESTS